MASQPQRRRIYLMRHGHVVYGDRSGEVVANPDLVPLSERGREQATAAGRYLKAAGVTRFDRVVSSNLTRSVETAEGVLAEIGQQAAPEQWPDLREIRGAGGSWGAPDEIANRLRSFAQPAVHPETRWMEGESVGDAQARILPAVARLRDASDWDVALVVLHNLVNTVILSHVLTGTHTFLGRLEQNFGCINALDVGAEPRDWIVRAINICPDPVHYQRTRQHSLEIMADQAARRGGH
jgi:probable phosphoglycerate mutase